MFDFFKKTFDDIKLDFNYRLKSVKALFSLAKSSKQIISSVSGIKKDVDSFKEENQSSFDNLQKHLDSMNEELSALKK
jgi:gas vesicle protein